MPLPSEATAARIGGLPATGEDDGRRFGSAGSLAAILFLWRVALERRLTGLLLLPFRQAFAEGDGWCPFMPRP
jgi:hypothetical protein